MTSVVRGPLLGSSPREPSAAPPQVGRTRGANALGPAPEVQAAVSAHFERSKHHATADPIPFGNAVDPRNHTSLRRLVDAAGAIRVLAAANHSLDQPPDPVKGYFSPPWLYLPNLDGIVDTARDVTQIQQMGTFALQVNSLCQAYALTGHEPYAQKAIQIADAWATETRPGFGSPQAGIASFHPLASVFNSLRALKEFTGWRSPEKPRFLTWAESFTHRAERLGDRYDNRHGWRIFFQASAAQLTGDATLFLRKVDDWRDAVRNSIDPDGLMPAELKRTRSLHYHVFALKALMAFAELARGMGLDLYGIVEGQQLRRSLRAVGPALVDGKRWKHPELFGEFPASGATLFELGARRFSGDPIIRAVADALRAKVQRNPGWLDQLVLGQLADGATHSGGFPLPNTIAYVGLGSLPR